MSPVTCCVSVKPVICSTPSPEVSCRPTSEGWKAAAAAVAIRAAPTVAAESVTPVFGVMPTSSCASTKKGKFTCFHAACPDLVSFTVGFVGWKRNIVSPDCV
jgi:hypothetical protein